MQPQTVALATPFGSRAAQALLGVQERICRALAQADGQDFRGDAWERAEGGGGLSRVLSGGGVFEKAAVLHSAIRGAGLPPVVLREHPQLAPDSPYFATGVSLICHPRNPYVPTVHFNVRYFEAGEVFWFGGGMDLTPYYPFREDCIHFHRTLKAGCDRHDPRHYAQFKPWCDRYFHIQHRAEQRGIGGIFFNYLKDDRERGLDFILDLGATFLEAYLPIVERRRGLAHGQRERDFLLYRRGRYVEFNLIYDQGTLFGLQSGGRIESILASLPPEVAWRYDWRPEPGSPEDGLAEFLVPQDWASLTA
jgi:coproporphyrinogen III oxidase